MRPKRILWISLFFVTTALIALGISGTFSFQPFHFAGTRLKTDLLHPDAYVRTDSLSSLPSDLIKIPMIRDVFTEDLVFYYDHHEDRISLSGAIKRIAYEHNVQFSDRLLSVLFNEPAQVLYWKDGHGALRQYAVLIEQNLWTKIFKTIGTIAADDSQLTLAGKIETKKGDVPVYALELNPRRTFLLISHGDTLIALSDPGLLLDANGSIVPESASVIQKWLEKPSTAADTFHMASEKDTAKHTLILKSSSLAFGYHPLMNGFEGIRFDFRNTWSSSIWLEAKHLGRLAPGDQKLWNASPASAALCTILPLDWDLMHRLVFKAEASEHKPDLEELRTLKGSAMACWYDESNISTPLFIVRSETPLPHRGAVLASLARWSFSDSSTITDKHVNNDPDSTIYKGDKNPATFGIRENYILFSPDSALVEKSLDTLYHRYPNVSDQIDFDESSIAFFTPKSLARMIERELTDSVQETGDGNLLSFVQSQLPPRMKALAGYSPYRLEVTEKVTPETKWYPLYWQPIKEKP